MNATIVSSDQYSTDPEGGELFMRMEFTLERGGMASLGRAFAQDLSERFVMRSRLADADAPKRMVLLVSREDHCLVDLRWRHRRGELPADLVVLARAVKWHLEDRVLVHGNRTVAF